MTDLSVVVVAYHNADLLQRCLSSLPHDQPVWVIDNSADPDVKAVTALHGATYVDTGSNLGFAGGVNAGLRLVPSGSDVLLVNPDAVIAEDALRTLHSHLRATGNERLAAVSPALLDPRDGSRQRVRWPLPTPGRMWREAIGLSRLLPPPDEYCIGAVLLLRREAIDDVGPFDERFFLYAEEADWQRRALDRGWHTAEVTAVIAEHIGAGTSSDLGRRELLFHAGIETYVRKWFGRSGWTSYRLAAFAGAAGRATLLRGTSSRAAKARASLYRHGPRQAAELPPQRPLTGFRILHVVVTNAFAGVERYVSEVAREQASRGADVTVVGGNPLHMRAAMRGVRHRAAASVAAAVHELARAGRQDVVHAHLTSAEFASVVAAPFHGAPVVSTRHIARQRGSTRVARLIGRFISIRLAQQIATSHYVATVIGEPSMVIWNSVRSVDDLQPVKRQRTVVLLQRLEQEKATDLAVRAWAASNLAADGWRMQIAGSGSQRGSLEALARRLGVDGSVEFLGHVDDTRRLLSHAGMLMATGTADAFGLSVAEAMSVATPVLASAGGAHPELLGPHGWTFPAGDADAAAEVLRRAAGTSPENRAAYGETLRVRQRNLFDLKGHVDALECLYIELSRN